MLWLQSARLKLAITMGTQTSISSLRGRALVTLLATVESAAIALALTSWIWSWPLPLHAESQAVVAVNVSDTSVARVPTLTTSYAPVVKRVAPSVVYVFSTKTVKNPFGREMRPLFDDPFFRRFFGDQFDEDSPRQEPRSEPRPSRVEPWWQPLRRGG